VASERTGDCGRIGVSHWYSADNLGDLAILTGQLQLLERRGAVPAVLIGVDHAVSPPPSVDVLEFTFSPWASPATSGLGPWLAGLCWALATLAFPGARLLPRRFREFVGVVAELDALMPKGGGYLYSRRGARGVLFTLRTCWPLFLARRLRVRRMIWGHSIGPADTWLGRALLQLALRGADIVVRDDASSELLRRWRLPHTRAPDLAFAWISTAPPPRTRPRPETSPITVGLTARNVGDDDVQRGYEDSLVVALTSLEQLIREESGRALRVQLCPQVLGPVADEDDRPVLARIQRRLPFKSSTLDLSHDDVGTALRQYAELDFLVATRLHSAILASCVQVPFVVYEYIGAKAQGAVRDLGLPDWVVVTRPGDLPAAVHRGWTEREALLTTYPASLPRILDDVVAATAGAGELRTT
jgi:polysaccharide pyruvyl transferase WcaK-like protein